MRYKLAITLSSIVLLMSASAWAGEDASASLGHKIKHDAVAAGHAVAHAAREVGHAVSHETSEAVHFVKKSVHRVKTGVSAAAQDNGDDTPPGTPPGH